MPKQQKVSLDCVIISKVKWNFLTPFISDLYTWLGTCDLTSITANKGRISLSSSDKTSVENIVHQVRVVVALFLNTFYLESPS